MIISLARTFKKTFKLCRTETFVIPQPGEGIAEVEIIQWLVNPNNSVKEFQILCEARSDKGFIEYKSPYDGVFKEYFYKASDIAKIGTPLYGIEIDDKKYPLNEFFNQKVIESPNKAKDPVVIPSVRILGNKNNLDLSKIQAPGKGGRLLKEDVIKYLENNKSPLSPIIEISKNTDFYTQRTVLKKVANTKDKIIALSPLQKNMLKTMTESLSIPQFSFNDDVCVNKIIDLKNSIKTNSQDLSLTFMPFFIKALSLALLDFPIINSTLSTSKKEYKINAFHNITVAIDSEQGLLLPNIKNVQNLSIFEIFKELQRLRDLGAKGKLLEKDFKDGTVAISNIGTIGGTYTAPIVLPLQVFIAGFGAIRPRIERLDNQFVEKFILPTSWSGDHRVLDGATCSRFVARWKAIIENPFLMLLHLK